MKAFIMKFIKGIAAGAGAVTPGVSGGTVAVCTGIFEPLLEAVSGIFRHAKKSFELLIPFCFGAITAVYAVSYPLSVFCSKYETVSKIVFCAISVISLIAFIKKSVGFDFHKSDFAFLFSGVVIAALLSVLLRTQGGLREIDGYVPVMLCGVLLAAALVLPAVSFSYMLLFFGLYEKTLISIQTFDIAFLLPLCTGIAVGCFITSSVLMKLISKSGRRTYCFVAGFVISSIADILC